MLPSVLTSQLQTGVEDFLRTTFPTTTPHFHGMLDRFFEREGAVFKGPYVNVDLPFRHGDHGADYFPEVPLGFPPYAHQAQAFERLQGPDRQSTLVATGTGSGKTEAFLWPVLDYVRRHTGEEGIKGLLIYPTNALANDQAGRIAEAVHEIDALDDVRVGLYVGEKADQPTVTMGKEHVITSRDRIRRGPPDLLLTNYKMLDYLLTRPTDATLWRYNDPETLQYLVVDELHTFDGAQGTDLACLLRRVKDRLDTPDGHLCCVGTSATLGGADDLEALRSYAEDVFAEPFDEGAIIGEDRISRETFLEDPSIATVPGPEQHDVLSAEAYDTPESYVRAQVPLWMGEDPPYDVMTDEGRVRLGETLREHRFFHQLLEALDGPRPASALLDDLAEEIPALREGPAAYRRAVLDSFLALLSWARSTVPTDEGTDPARFVQLRSQLWLRELRRMVASVDDDPELRFWDDLPEPSNRDPHLPVAHCLECGAMGWVGIHRQNENQFRDDLKGIYRRYFDDEPTYSFAFPISHDQAVEAEGRRHQFCGHDLHLSPPDAETCEACGRSDRLLPVYRPKNRKTTQDGRQVGSHDCPFCGTRNGLTIVGSQAASLTSVLISQLYASGHNDDKKLLTFSDSVQDAAHRAGYFGARTYRFNLRGAIQAVVDEREPMTLDALQDEVASHYRETMTPEAFVSTFIAPDMEWFEQFEHLQRTGRFPDDSTLVEDVARRLQWEVWSEYGFRARTGRTLEKTGSSVAAPDPDRLQDATKALSPVLRNVGNLRGINEPQVRRFLSGIAQHLKTQGAVFHPELSTYVEHGGNHYVLNKRPHMPSYGSASRLPAFVAETSTNRFDPVLGASGDGQSWLEAWAVKCFGDDDPMLEGALDTVYTETLDALVEASVLHRETTRTGSHVWGLRPAALRVGAEVAQLRCERCGHNVSVGTEQSEVWTGTPCLRYPCAGAYAQQSETRNYYRRLYRQGDLQRIVAREHTGLLARDQREDIEQSFQQRTHPWDPNLLSCTPTLELGVDVGTLSSVILCSVPPTPSNFVQRIGRGGRRSGNAVDVTVANGRPHDLYFFEDPTEMIAGAIEPPGVFLGAVEVLVRQYVAFCFDRWVGSGVPDGAVPNELSRVLRHLDDESVFPHPWLSFVETQSDALFDAFVDLFGDVLDAERVEALAGAVEKDGGIARRVLGRLAAIKKRRTDLHRRSRRLYRNIKDLKKGPMKGEAEQRLEEMQREKQALQEIYQSIGEKNTYNFFTDAGLLPNYAFPESGVTLRSILYRHSEEDAPDVWDEEFVRPAPQALTELAPGSTFYANGRRVQVDQIDLTAEEVLERWRLCDRCAHMEHVVEEGAAESSCPECGSPTWSDQGQERTLVRHDEVRATTADAESRIDDASDGREQTFFEMAFLANVEPEHIGTAYRIDDQDLPFGFEFVETATFREVNFGRPRERTLLEVGGTEIKGQGFRTCSACGRVAINDAPIEHTRSCSVRQQNGAARDPTSLFLYREISSEALRILLPETSFAGTPEKVESFKAAFELGLEEYFDGSVDHLKTAIQESPGDQEIARRRYLLVYDSVPGGTGYLADLLRKKEVFMKVLKAALDVLQACACREEERRDGCYRCLYAYRNHYDMPHTSRSSAEELLEAIWEHRDQLVEIDSVDQISVQGAVESELEARFLQRLRDLEGSVSHLSPTTVRGGAGYELTIGDHAYDIEPQVEVGPSDGVPRACSIDFVLHPDSDEMPPIAVFLDGLQYHRNRIGRDLAQRRTLRASGKYLVWSLTWRDVAGEHSAHYRNYLTPANETFGKLLAKTGEERAQKSGALLNAESFDWLIELLRSQDTDLFKRVALIQALLLARRQTEEEVWTESAQAHLPDPLADLLTSEVDAENHLLGQYDGSNDSPSDPVQLWAAAPHSAVQELTNQWRTPLQEVVVALYLDDSSNGTSSLFEASWNGVLRLYNLFQFLPQCYPVSAEASAFQSYEELIGRRDAETLQAHLPQAEPATFDEEEWASVREHTLPETESLLEMLYEKKVPAPDLPTFALRKNGEIVAEAELAWPEARVVVLLDDQTEDETSFSEDGWTTHFLSDVQENPDLLLDSLQD